GLFGGLATPQMRAMAEKKISVLLTVGHVPGFELAATTAHKPQTIATALHTVPALTTRPPRAPLNPALEALPRPRPR
ncbi:hypothetical protein ACFXPA_46085, partial [Amycolatopsis sp. NPDC059090]|uniref:hypothetical protein n=1 Tax=Amycolatopsis sp. NPDC059090 TaxID=3346723 RepID=UPI0036731CDC